jgi:hypothetical protein
MDIATLAVTMTSFLSPLFPFLIKGTEEAAKEAGKKFGSNAWEKAKELWDKISKTKSVEEAAKDLVKVPNDEDFEASLRKELKKLLQDQPVLAQELLQLMQSDLSEDEHGDTINQSIYGKNNKAIGKINGGSVDIKF